MSDLSKELNWDVDVKEVQTLDNIAIDSHRAIVRNDNEEVLSVMKKSYRPLHNGEFKERVSRLADISGFELTGFNEFKEGAKVLAFLKNNQEVTKIGNHTMDNYMVIGNSFDGSSSFFVGTSTVLIRCQNQFSQIAKMMKVRHTKNSELKMDEIYSYFDFYLNNREKMFENFNRFGQVNTNDELREKMVHHVLGIKNSAVISELSTRKTNQIAALYNSIAIEEGDLGTNLWSLFNGVTRYTTHELNQKNQTFGSVFGSAATFNDKAYELAVQLENNLTFA